MALDKLVDSSQLDADLTSVANAIRTKGGTSAQLAFPSGFVSAVQAIPSGGGVSSVLRFEDFKTPSSKWIIQEAVPNVLKTGGCLHIIRTHGSLSSDVELISFGYGNLSQWSPTSYAAVYFLDYTGTNKYMRLRFRSSNIDGTIPLNQYYDENDEIEVKLYSDRLVNVKDGNVYALSTFGNGVVNGMNSILAKNYLSIGQNQTTAVGGQIVSLFAFEES